MRNLAVTPPPESSDRESDLVSSDLHALQRGARTGTGAPVHIILRRPMPPSDENARCLRAKANDQWGGPWKSIVKAWAFVPLAVSAGARSLIAVEIAVRVNCSSPSIRHRRPTAERLALCGHCLPSTNVDPRRFIAPPINFKLAATRRSGTPPAAAAV